MNDDWVIRHTEYSLTFRLSILNLLELVPVVLSLLHTARNTSLLAFPLLLGTLLLAIRIQTSPFQVLLLEYGCFTLAPCRLLSMLQIITQADLVKRINVPLRVIQKLLNVFPINLLEIQLILSVAINVTGEVHVGFGLLSTTAAGAHLARCFFLTIRNDFSRQLLGVVHYRRMCLIKL